MCKFKVNVKLNYRILLRVKKNHTRRIDKLDFLFSFIYFMAFNKISGNCVCLFVCLFICLFVFVLFLFFLISGILGIYKTEKLAHYY